MPKIPDRWLVLSNLVPYSSGRTGQRVCATRPLSLLVTDSGVRIKEKASEIWILTFCTLLKLFFKIISKNHEYWCAVYKPTGMTTIASNLLKGDKICVGGGVRKASKNLIKQTGPQKTGFFIS